MINDGFVCVCHPMSLFSDLQEKFSDEENDHVGSRYKAKVRKGCVATRGVAEGCGREVWPEGK